MIKMDNPDSYDHHRYQKIVNRVTATILSILWFVSVWMFILPSYGTVEHWSRAQAVFMLFLIAIALPCVVAFAIVFIFGVVFPGICQFFYWLCGYD